MPRPIARRHPLPKQPSLPPPVAEVADAGEPPKPKRKRKKAE